MTASVQLLVYKVFVFNRTDFGLMSCRPTIYRSSKFIKELYIVRLCHLLSGELLERAIARTSGMVWISIWESKKANAPLYRALRNVLKYIGTLVFSSFEYVARCNKDAKHEIRWSYKRVWYIIIIWMSI